MFYLLFWLPSYESELKALHLRITIYFKVVLKWERALAEAAAFISLSKSKLFWLPLKLKLVLVPDLKAKFIQK